MTKPTDKVFTCYIPLPWGEIAETLLLVGIIVSCVIWGPQAALYILVSVGLGGLLLCVVCPILGPLLGLIMVMAMYVAYLAGLPFWAMWRSLHSSTASPHHISRSSSDRSSIS